VLELAAFSRVVESLGFEDARLVWPQVRSDFGDSATDPQLALVVDLQRKEAHLVQHEERIGSLVRHGRPVRVITLSDELSVIATRYRELATILGETS
jgi:hypothetical protein